MQNIYEITPLQQKFQITASFKTPNDMSLAIEKKKRVKKQRTNETKQEKQTNKIEFT